MDSYRLIINNYDESSVTAMETSEGTIGYTVVTSPKGPANGKPVLVTSVSQLYNTFGEPSRDYPELYEAATFIGNGHSLYVCSAGAKEVEGGDAEDKSNYVIVASEGNFLSENQLTYKNDVLNFIEEGDSDAVSNTLSGLIPEDGVEVRAGNYGAAYRGTVGEGPSSQKVIYFKINTLTAEKYVTTADSEVDGVTHNLVGPGLPKIGTTESPKKFHLSGLSSNTISTTDVDLYVDGTNVTEDISGSKVIGKVGYIKIGDGSSKVTTNQPLADDLVGSDYAQVIYILGGDDSGDTTLKTSGISTLYESNSNRQNLVLEDVISIMKSHVKAIIFPKAGNTDPLKITFAAKESTGDEIERERDAEVRNTLIMSVGGTTIQGTLGGSASNCFNTESNSSYAQDFIAVYEIGSFENSDLLESDVEIDESNIEGTITIPAGTKAVASKTTIEEAWANASDSEFDDVAIFFDSRKHGTLPDGSSAEDLSGGFAGLKASRPLCNFIYNYTVAKTGGKLEDAEARVIGNNFYTISNFKKVSFTPSDGSKATSFYSPMTGAYASMIATIIDDAHGGIAPMFLNSSGMGGQLSFPVGNRGNARMAYNYSSDDQKALEKKNYNPVIYDNTYGTMVVAQRTNASGVLTDWSYIGHVCSFLTLQREIRTNVMIPQLGKANNDYYRSLRAEQVSQLLRYRLEGSNAIWNAATVDTSTNTGVNDTQAQKAKKFIINVRVKPEPYSEYVILNFTNYNDSSTSEATVV